MDSLDRRSHTASLMDASPFRLFTYTSRLLTPPQMSSLHLGTHICSPSCRQVNVPECQVSGDLRVDPLLQRVSELLPLDWLCQRAEGGLELCDGGGQIPEPTSCAQVLLQ